jgi:hypothetical protein
MSSAFWLPWFAFAGAVLALALVWRHLVVASKRRQFIRHFQFPSPLFVKLREQHPQLDARDCSLVAQALRQFFLAYLLGGRRPVGMPSKVVDDLWHAFILHTRSYHAFCREAFGRFLHHTPSAAMGRSRELNAGLRRVWWHVCKEDNIDPREPKRIPLLFAIDRKLGIQGGHHYHLPALAAAGVAHAMERVADGVGSIDDGWTVDIFSDKAVDGSTDGFPDTGGDGGDGGGCGGD